ncbi:MAG: sulfotransferase, partial [Acidimicrobiales bacterium]
EGGAEALEWEASDQAGRPGRTTVVVERSTGHRHITGEATASTFHEVPPALLHAHLPDTKLIVLVRNPVDRAFSHHRMYRRFTAGGYDLGVPVGEFEPDVHREMRAHLDGQATLYIGPGAYVDLLDGWAAVYGRGRVRVFVTEELGRPRGARRIMAELEEYLGLPAHDYGGILERRFNRAPSASMQPALRAELAEFYRPYNNRLQAWLGRDLDWH